LRPEVVLIYRVIRQIDDSGQAISESCIMSIDDLLIPILIVVALSVSYLLYRKDFFRRPRKTDRLFSLLGVFFPFVDIIQTVWGVQRGWEGNQAVVWFVGNLHGYWFPIFALGHVAFSVLSFYLKLKGESEQEKDVRFFSALLGLIWLFVAIWNIIALTNNAII